MELPVFPERWSAGDPVLVTETFSSRIWKVRLADGQPAIVKALKPFDDVDDELRGAHLLEWRDGLGAVRLLGFEGMMMMLEHAGERHLSDEIDAHGDGAATLIAAEVLERLHAPSDRPAPPQLQPLRERFAALFDKAGADRAAGNPSLYVEAATLAERLLDEAIDVRPLHGDLHHDNILFGPRGWLSIDPKGVLGDPGFDAANLFYNPLGRDDLCRAPERIAFMAATLAASIRQDERRVLDHAVAYGCLSAAWHAGDSNAVEEERELSIVRAIRAVRLSS
ncbi:MAG: phosphotransferase [Rhizobiaceae bacterium]|nr:phosphotransferase [Rhizobiaceae bacterium]